MRVHVSHTLDNIEYNQFFNISTDVKSEKLKHFIHISVIANRSEDLFMFYQYLHF